MTRFVVPAATLVAAVLVGCDPGAAVDPCDVNPAACDTADSGSGPADTDSVGPSDPNDPAVPRSDPNYPTILSSDPQVILFDDFAACDEVPGSLWRVTGDWACGDLEDADAGPLSCPTGGRCLATNPNGRYANGLTWDATWAELGPLDLSDLGEPMLELRVWSMTEGDEFDGWHVSASANGGASFQVVESVVPAYHLTIGRRPAWGGDDRAKGWHTRVVDLRDYQGAADARVRINFRSDLSVRFDGVYLDQVTLRDASIVPITLPQPHTLPPSVLGEAYSTVVVRAGGSSAVRWERVSGTNDDWMSLDPVTGELSGVPADVNEGPGTITLRATDTSNPTNTAQATYDFEVTGIVFEDGFEDCPGGWSLQGDWQCGSPNSGPGSAYRGTGVLATILGGNYNNGRPWATNHATSPSFNIPERGAELSFYLWWRVEGASWDGFNLQVSADGGPFQILQTSLPYNATVQGQSAWNGTATTNQVWRRVTADLSPYAGQQVRLRYAMFTDGSVTFEGAYIDEIVVE